MDRVSIAKAACDLVVKGLGLNLSDPNLSNTPDRLQRMYADELCSSLEKESPVLTKFPNGEKYDEIVLLDNIPFTSLCSHHFLPFSGRAWFAYVPYLSLVGASKVARLIHYYSKKPQLQEALSIEIVDHFIKELHPKGVMLVMRAVHGCMSCRGVMTGFDAGMTTSVLRGCFKEDARTRAEAMALIQLSITDRR